MQLLIQELWAGILVCISKKAQPRAQGAFLNSQEVAFQGKNPGKTLQEFSDNNRFEYQEWKQSLVNIYDLLGIILTTFHKLMQENPQRLSRQRNIFHETVLPNRNDSNEVVTT